MAKKIRPKIKKIKNEEAGLNSLKAKIERLEKKVFGEIDGDWIDEKRIFLSKKGTKQFPEMKREKFYLIRWCKKNPEMIMVRRRGKKSLEQYHHSFFKI